MAIKHESEGMMRTDIGNWIYENDPYIEDEATCTINWLLASNPNIAMRMVLVF